MLIRLRVRQRADGPFDDREFMLDALRVGRAPSADLVIPDDTAQTVSWQHARVDATAEGIVLSDLKSTNGTFLNGRRIEGAERLRVGDRIQLGQTGPTLEVVVLEAHNGFSRSTPAAADRPSQPPPMPRRERRTPVSAPRSAMAGPGQVSATRALLIHLQKKQKKWMFGAAAVLVVAGAITAFMLVRHEVRITSLEDQMAQVNAKFVDFEADLDSVKAKQAEIDHSTEKWYADFDSLDKAARSGNASGEAIYQRTAQSTAWVIADRGGDGSGSLVEHEGKLLIVTSYHVVHGARRIGVRFPQVLNGKVLANQGHYIREDSTSGKDAIPCTVWASDPGVDIAILEPTGLPANLHPLQIADSAPSPGADVHTVGGDPAGSNALWSYSCGKVRQVTGPVDLQTRSGRTVHATIIETQNPVNRGDSGGPLVNNKCELVGVTFGGVDGANLVTRFIDVSHVKDVLRNRPRKTISAPAPQPTVNVPSPITPPAAHPSAARGRVYVLLLIDDCDERRKDGKPGIAQGCRADGERMRALFKNGLPPGTYEVKTLQGREADRVHINRYYNELRSRATPGDTVFCYYTGHGCIDRNTGAHYLAMHGGGYAGPPLLVPRAEVLSLMQSTHTKLSVLITDCCSSFSGGISRGPETTEYSRNQYLVPLLKRNHGVVDWQAASPGETASGFNSGGLFTTQFCAAVSNGGYQTWGPPLLNEVHSRMQKFVRDHVRKRPVGAGGTSKVQTPYQFPTTNVRRD